MLLKKKGSLRMMLKTRINRVNNKIMKMEYKNKTQDKHKLRIKSKQLRKLKNKIKVKVKKKVKTKKVKPKVQMKVKMMTKSFDTRMYYINLPFNISKVFFSTNK